MSDVELELAPDLEAQAEEELESPLADLDFTFFHANSLSYWLRNVPGKVNWLASAWYLEHTKQTNPKHQYPEYQALPNDATYRSGAQCDDGAYAGMVFLDSGLLTPIGRVIKGHGTTAEVDAWLADQGLVQRWAWRLHEAGTPPSVAAMIDHNAAPKFLQAVERTWEESLDWTLRNAEAWGEHELPPGWKHVYVVQGTNVDQAAQCLEAYELLGVLDAVRAEQAWLAIGSIATTKPPALDHRVVAVRRAVGPVGHIHVLGVAAPKYLEHMVARGWCQSSDSASVAQQVRGNNGPYAVPNIPGNGVSRPTMLPRQMYFYYAQFAAAARWHDHNLGVGLLERAGKHTAGDGPDQLELIGAEG